MATKQNSPELSIVIITKNEEHYLPRLLGSIRTQEYKDYEIIVADNNSSDKTREIARDAGCIVVDGGLPAEGRNAGARVARGRYLLFLDADVVLPQGFLPRVLEEFKQRELGIAEFYARPIDCRALDKIGVWLWNLAITPLSKFRPLGYGHCVLVKAEIHKKLGGFDTSLTHAEDIDYFRRAIQITKFAIIKSKRVFVSMRRFYTQGYLQTMLKLAYATIQCFIHKRPKVKVNYP
ncbi:glycosyltransferase, partial [Candidatus Woesearchaeota archaeon]|nr:glycosyltransferase [Candidatus Woesearchaeota archaeon]